MALLLAMTAGAASLLWVIAAILVIWGIVVIIQGSVLGGVMLILFGALIGPGGISIFR